MRNQRECVSELRNGRGVLRIQLNSDSENRPEVRVRKPTLQRLLLAALSLVLVLLIVTRSTGFANDKKKDPTEIGIFDVAKGVNFCSLEKEIGLGKVLAQEVERQAKIINDPVIAEYVNRVGQNLVGSSDANLPFTIHVIDSDEVNAFALPARCSLNSGLILKADTGAIACSIGRFERAHRGTLFLDEIGDFPLELQSKRRVLQDMTGWSEC